MSPGRFAAILRDQLKVSQGDFWETIRSGRPAPRPSVPLPAAPPAHPAWVIRALKHQFGMSENDIARLSVEEARRYVAERWSSPKDAAPP
ncbi:MAG: hypothetical protein HYY04_16235 [Chloroflexi bacterium]|nr:hypothetical protein [Chloroflexota bacterium]